jgi:hypothetical protein
MCGEVDLKSKLDNSTYRISGVYGPSTTVNRSNFFSEMVLPKPSASIPWLICSDFNQTLNLSGRSTLRRQQDAIFQQLIQNLGLIDLTLHGRRFTWSNEQDTPTFVRLDRFLVSTAWCQAFPNCIQITLATTSSDHSPILCICSTKFPMPNTFKFEIFWLRIQGFPELVQQTWLQKSIADTPKTLHQKMIKLRKVMRNRNKEGV